MVFSPAHAPLVAALVASLLGAPSQPPAPAAAVGADPWRIEGDQAGAHLGSSLATADVNGDGYGDLVVGAPGYDHFFHDEGRVTVYLGSSGGMSTTPAWTRYGRQHGAHFGSKVAAAGDVNGDGFDDVLVSAPDFDRNGIPSKGKAALVGQFGGHEHMPATDEGLVQLYLGSPAGLATVPQRSVTGIELGEHFGTALAGPGDVNGDGFDDVLVGATGKQDNLGGAFLFAGGPSGMAALPAWIRLGDLADTGFGSVVGGAGDVNADGFADLLTSAPAQGNCGRLSLFMGSGAGPASTPIKTIAEKVIDLGPSEDFDQNGSLELFYATGAAAGSCATAAPRWRRLASTDTGQLPILGLPAAVAAGDLNGDGRVDLVTSVPEFHDGPFHGRVYVYMNRAGSTFAPTASFPVFDGDQAGAGWGEALAAVDVDGDSSDELFVAAPRQDAGDEDEGTVTLFPGWNEDLHLVQTFTQNIGSYGAAVADYDGDGYSDLVRDFGEQLEVRYGSPTGLSATADGQLVKPALVSHNELFFGMSTGDIDGDGHDDLQVSFNPQNWGGHGGYLVDTVRHSLYMGSSAGLALNPVLTIDGGSSGEAEIVGDVNGDGYDDLLVLRDNLGDQLYLGSGAGLQATPVQTLPSAYTYRSASDGGFGSRHRAVLAGNLDGDGYGDVVIARYTTPTYTLYMDIFHGSASGLVLQTFWDASSALGLTGTYTYYYAEILDLQDYDADGLDDLLIDVFGESTLCLRSTGGFTRSPQWWEPSNSGAFWNNRVLAAGDVDQDGLVDFLLEGARLHRGSALEIARTPSWFGTLTFPIQGLWKPGDFDGDGRMELVCPYYPLRIFEFTP